MALNEGPDGNARVEDDMSLYREQLTQVSLS